MLASALTAWQRLPRGRSAAVRSLLHSPWTLCHEQHFTFTSSAAAGEQGPGDAGDAPPDSACSSGAAAAAFAAPKQRPDKPPLSQKVRFVDRLVVEVAGGKGGGGGSSLFGRTGERGSGPGLESRASCRQACYWGRSADQLSPVRAANPAASHAPGLLFPSCDTRCARPQATTRARPAATAAGAATSCSVGRAGCWVWGARRFTSPEVRAAAAASSGW
jgi:hypothetical protein